MSFGKNIGIGPALRVLRHFIERRRFYQLKFSSGEQALILIAGMPAPSVELVRLTLGGFLPWQTVWEYNPARAGGYSDYVHKFKAIFSPPSGIYGDSDHDIRDALLPCKSIEEAHRLLLDRERRANGAASEGASSPPSYDPNSIPDDDWRLESDAPTAMSTPASPKIPGLRNRYRIREDAGVRVLTCVEAPMIRVRARRGLSIPAKQARGYPAGTIFLDGAAQGEPFVDFKNDLYNLDHPEECVQTLATCEQALLLIRKGLDLRKRDWSVWANDSDLDTIFAIWVLLNHLRFNDDAAVRDKVMPLLRLEGAIDAHGPEAQYLTALPPDLLRSITAMRKQLQQQEFVLKSYGRWSEFDLLEYIADRLRAIDEMVYGPESFADLHEVDELARAEMANGLVALVCAADADMDTIQAQLQRFYGERLGVLIFQDGASNYRVRQIDRNLPALLGGAFERLNLLDPAAASGVENRWGGSMEEGCSPRKTGSSLTPGQIVAAVKEAFWAPTFLDVASALPGAVLLAAAGMLPALALTFVGNLLRNHGFIGGETVLLSAVVLTITVGIIFASRARRSPGLYGWRIPAGLGWASVFPAAFIGGAMGGAWAPGSLAYWLASDNLYSLGGITALLLPLAAELLFRGVILGHLAARLPIQKSAGPWWNSWPTLISTVLYTVASLLVFATLSKGEIPFTQWLLVVGGAAIFGTACGVARERSDSVLPPVLLHWVCAAALLFLSYLSI